MYTSSTTMQKALADCRRVGSDAITLEDQDKHYDAYRKYLFCCVKAFATLTEEINDMKLDNNSCRLELAKLAKNCAERIAVLCENRVSNTVFSFHNAASSPNSMPPPQTRQAHRTVSASSVPTQPKLTSPTEIPSGSVCPTHTVGVARFDLDDPVTLARLQNQALLDRHKKQMENPNYSAARKARLSIELQKKMLENLELAKRRKIRVDQQLLERHQQLKVFADRRIAALNLSDPKIEKQHNDLLTAILLHDEKHKRLLSQKLKLSEGEGLNITIAHEFCRNVMRSTTHPLAILLRDAQQKVKEVTEPLYVKYNKLLVRCVRVPYEYADPKEELSDQAIAQLEDTIPTDTGVDNAFGDNCDRNSEEIKTAIYKTDKEIGKLLDSKPEPSGDKKTEDEDDMDYLFDSDEEDSGNGDSEKPDNSLQAQPSVVRKDNSRQELDEIQSFDTVFSKQLEIVTKSLHETIYSLSTLLMLAYDNLNCEEGCGVIDAAIHECLFMDIGEQLQLLYRLANMKKERIMAQVMTKYMNKDISSMQTKEKWYLGTRGECYDHLVNRLQNIVSIYAPLEKMNCAVKVNRGVAETTAAYFQAKNMNREPMGADDLLPIICFIVAKSGLPQIISECAIMEEFMPADYMKEEEGYCLATVLTAVEYLLGL